MRTPRDEKGETYRHVRDMKRAVMALVISISSQDGEEESWLREVQVLLDLFGEGNRIYLSKDRRLILYRDVDFSFSSQPVPLPSILRFALFYEEHVGRDGSAVVVKSGIHELPEGLKLPKATEHRNRDEEPPWRLRPFVLREGLLDSRLALAETAIRDLGFRKQLCGYAASLRKK